MGFAASQARFLSLTARMSDNEYEAGQISQERLALTNQMAQYADEYDSATNNQVITASVFEDLGTTKSTVVLSYDVISKDLLDGGLGMKLITSSGLVVVPDEDEMQKQIEASNGELSVEDFYIFKEVSDTSILQKNLEEGNFYLSAAKSEVTGDWDKKSVEQIAGVTYTYDTTDDAAAKATYDKRMKIAESKDAMLEMRLDQLESNHKALETEMEAIEKVVDSNVEKSFNSFG